MPLATDTLGNTVQIGRLGMSQNLSTSATAAHTAAVASSAFAVRVTPSTDTQIAIGTGAVATTSSTMIRANQTEYFAIAAGERVSAVSASAGTLNVAEIV